MDRIRERASSEGHHREPGDPRRGLRLPVAALKQCRPIRGLTGVLRGKPLQQFDFHFEAVSAHRRGAAYRLQVIAERSGRTRASGHVAGR